MKRLAWMFVLFFAFSGLGALAASAQAGYGYRARPYYGPNYRMVQHQRMERRAFRRHEIRERRRFLRHERRERMAYRHYRYYGRR